MSFQSGGVVRMAVWAVCEGAYVPMVLTGGEGKEDAIVVV